MTGNPDRSGSLDAPVLPRAMLAPAPSRPTRYAQLLKPALDRILGTLATLLALPLFTVTAVAIWARLGRPVLLRQTRIGRHGHPFTLYKFRTMHPDRRTHNHPIGFPDRRTTHKHPDDPRHTPIGRLLRKYSVDELPQLLNVLRGDMSLIGPRPELPHIVGRYQAWQHRRHHVKPGLTGLWQVTERGNGLMHEHTHLDLHYARHVTWRQDLSILLRTIPTLLGRSCQGE
jgi:lipopolysaccharide/colanic/teichoic acid biosynthesis glycosyltransferase